MSATLPLRHFLLALAVVFVWGTNFTIVKVALGHMPPLLFAALRFALAFFPAALFLPRPAVAWPNVARYGVLIGVCQFGLLYSAMDHYISPGLASLVIQVQVFFTVGLSMHITGERVRPIQWIALLLAATGIVVIALHADGTTTVRGLAMVVCAALGWAGGNITARSGAASNLLAYVVWSSAFAVPPLLALSLLFDGWPAMLAGLRQTDLATWAAVGWQSWGNTLFTYTAWAWLLARHPAATISPISLLVPVFGLATSALLLGEALPAWKQMATALVLAGLALNLLWPRVRTALARGRPRDPA